MPNLAGICAQRVRFACTTASGSDALAQRYTQNKRDLATWFDCQPRSYSTKIMFEPGVLPEEFPKERERRARMPMPLGTEPQEAAPAEDMQDADFAEQNHCGRVRNRLQPNH
jgi:hypothetical protein